MKTMKQLVLLLTMALCLGTGISAHGQGDNIVPEVKISAHSVVHLNYTFGVAPATVTIKRGTTVIWMNDERSAAAIQFTGRQVTLACKSPVHFIVDDKGSFTSDKIPQGGVASLCFVEKGAFEYIVKRDTPPTAPGEAPREFKGKVIVE
jgi:plastocyanin